MAAVWARALYDFQGQQEGDLTFNENDVLLILDKDESGWWVGQEQTTGVTGDFPSNYCELISEEEAERAQRMKNTKPKEFAFKGDRVTSVKVLSSEISSKSKQLKFSLEARTAAGKTRAAKKSMAQLRDLDKQVRPLVPNFAAPNLPPAWADGAALPKLDVTKRETAVEHYLSQLAGAGETADFLLLVWMFPGERIEMTAAPDAVTAAGTEAKRAGADRASVRADPNARGQGAPTLAVVEFTWTPQDSVELFMEEAQVIAIVSQDTGSPGWWQGETAAGSAGLLPFNHVELLDARVAGAVLAGTPLAKAQEMRFSGAGAGGYADTTRGGAKAGKKLSVRASLSRISLGLLGKGGKEAAPAKAVSDRQRRVEAPFTLSSCEAFDRLIDNGFAMESNGKLMAMSPARDGPKTGDFVQLRYSAYLWNEQQQSLVEFAASDLASKLAPEGGLMEFFVGGGEVVKGVEFAVQRMSLGQSARVAVMPQLAFGKAGLPPDVPPSSHVVFDISLEAFGSESSSGAAAAPIDLGLDQFDLPPPPALLAPSEGRGLASARPKPTLSKPQKPSAPKAQQQQQQQQQAPPPPSAGGKPTSLQDAIALRRQKLEAQGGGFRPVADHRSARNPAGNPGGAAQARASFRGQPTPAQPSYDAPAGQYSLEQLQEAVREKQTGAMRVDVAVIEDYMGDAEFQRAFKMSRAEFLLKPLWRQQALKRGVGLF